MTPPSNRKGTNESGNTLLSPSFHFKLVSIKYPLRLPLIRELSTSTGSFISSNDSLLLAMLSSEGSVTGQTYTNGAKAVNLHPDHMLPIEVWLSKRDEDLRAAGVNRRLIEEGYAPTDEELMREYNKRHLRAIVVPPSYEKLDENTQRLVLQTLSDPSFTWSTSALLALPSELNPLKLTKGGKHLAVVHKFVLAMKEAVNLGVATVDDLTPNFARIHNPALEAFTARRREQAPSSTDIGASKSSDLDSYTLSRLPNESNEHFFTRLCRTRCRGAADGAKVQLPHYLDLEVTPLALKLIAPSANDVRVGQLLKEANTHIGKKVGERRLNYLGEVPGMCRQTNTKDRVDKIIQACQISSALDSLASGRKKVIDANKRTKSLALAAVTERRRYASQKAAVKNDELDSLKFLLKAAPANGTKFTANELKHFITTQLDNNYPNVARKTTLAVVIPYLLKVVELQLEDNHSLEDAGELARDQLETPTPPSGGARVGRPRAKPKRRPPSAVGRTRGRGRGRGGGGLRRGRDSGRRGDSKEKNGGDGQSGEDDNGDKGGDDVDMENGGDEEDSDDEDNESGNDGGGGKESDKRQSDDESDGDDQELPSGEKQFVVKAIKGVREAFVKIGNSKKRVKELQYLVSWEDYESCDDSWEAATSVVAEEAIAAYNASVANINVADSDDSSDDNRPLSLLLGRR
jgi:hypothetical protein